jgi:hypothetical protein
MKCQNCEIMLYPRNGVKKVLPRKIKNKNSTLKLLKYYMKSIIYRVTHNPWRHVQRDASNPTGKEENELITILGIARLGECC